MEMKPWTREAMHLELGIYVPGSLRKMSDSVSLKIYLASRDYLTEAHGQVC